MSFKFNSGICENKKRRIQVNKPCIGLPSRLEETGTTRDVLWVGQTQSSRSAGNIAAIAEEEPGTDHVTTTRMTRATTDTLKKHFPIV